MRTFSFLDGSPVPVGISFRSGEGEDAIQYPANWLELASADDLAANGIVAEEVADPPPPPSPVPEVISDRQFFQGLAVSGIITKPEALAAVKTGAIPAALQVIVDATGDANVKFGIEMLLSGATFFERHHPFAEAVRQARGMTDGEVDTFWRMCATL